MFFTTHAITGAAIGAASPSSAIGFILAVASHHILDSILHFDQGTLHNEPPGPNFLNKRFFIPRIPFTAIDWRILFADLGLAAVLGFLIIFTRPADALPSIIAGGFGGLFPDLLHSSPLWSKTLIKKSRIIAKYSHWHTFFHWTARPNQKFLGLATQIILVSFALYKLF